MNKYKLFMIISVCILLITIGGTYAWYVWKSSTNAIVDLYVCTPTVYFSGGKEINGKNFMPVLNKEDGIKKEIEVRLNKSCDNEAFMNLYMKLDVLDSGLSDETFVYELYKSNNLISSGNFANKKEGDIITLASNEEITEESSIYMLYIYLDGNQANPDATQNQRFKFSLYSEGTGAIYKENVMLNPSNSSYFLNTSILKEKVQSVTIAKDNTVPEEAVESFDISSAEDGSVILWYKDEDNNNLYEVYIGGKNGVVKANTNGNGMFSDLNNAISIDLENFDTSNVTNMSQMFYGCSSLTSLNLSSFDTSNVKSMYRMFFSCRSLTSLDVSTFNTSNVTNMSQMFIYSRSIKSLDLSSFDTSNVTNMSGMFSGCKSLKSLNLSTFNTSKVTDMNNMFWDCSSLTNLDLSSFDTSKVTNMSAMFGKIWTITSLDLSSFDTSKVTSVSWMFYGCRSLRNLDLRNANFSNVTNFGDMFGPEGYRVPYTSTIYVKDEVQKGLLTNKYPNYTNIIIY